MRRVIGGLLTVLLLCSTAWAGGIVTNTNQSAEFIRLLNRNASTAPDAVYYNPAGIMRLGDGLHLYASNQTITQDRKVIAHFPALNRETFNGETSAPLFPNVYAAYTTGKLAVSAGLMPIGGGGSAKYSHGLPSFELPVASLVGLPAGLINPALQSYGTVTGYSMDASFEGSSIYLGGQVNLSYALSDMLDLAVGARLVSAKNTYQGSLENVVLNATNGQIAGVIPNIEVDATQTGTGYTGIVGVNVTPVADLNVGLRYELLTKLQVTNDTKQDGTTALVEGGMFPDGAKTNADIPATLALGAAYRVAPRLKAHAGFTYFFNKDANWDGMQKYVNNGSEYGLGLEYNAIGNLWLSAGVLQSKLGAKDSYQSDLDYALDANTVGGGAFFQFDSGLAVSVGVLHSYYLQGQNAEAIASLKQEYEKSATVISAGLQYALP